MTETKRNAVGALLIHGLGGTQYDLGLMHKVLKRAGIDTHALTLPGHGSAPEDLLSVNAEDWVEAVRAKYLELRPLYPTLHVIGMCMGALLAIEVVKREHHRNGSLVTLAPPVFIDGWSTPWYRALRYLVYKFPPLARRMKVEEAEPYGIKNELVRSIVKAKFERNDNFHYRWVPLYCIQQVDRLRGWVKQNLADIHCPTLIMHAREDELTSLHSARFLDAQLGTQDKKLVVLENSYHMICVDNDRELVAQTVLEHFGLDPALAKPRRRTAAAETAETSPADE